MWRAPEAQTCFSDAQYPPQTVSRCSGNKLSRDRRRGTGNVLKLKQLNLDRGTAKHYSDQLLAYAACLISINVI